MESYLRLRGWRQAEYYPMNWQEPGAPWHSHVYRLEQAVAVQAHSEFANAATIRALVADTERQGG